MASTWKGVTYGADRKIISCLFCRICDLKEPASILPSPVEKFVAFRTIAPVTHTHVLISPREHISNFSSLEGHAGATLVEEMLQV
jgi:diadenosine tetraphosphate (Ap4A) HIT family hydrolase